MSLKGRGRKGELLNFSLTPSQGSKRPDSQSKLKGFPPYVFVFLVLIEQYSISTIIQMKQKTNPCSAIIQKFQLVYKFNFITRPTMKQPYYKTKEP